MPTRTRRIRSAARRRARASDAGREVARRVQSGVQRGQRLDRSINRALGISGEDRRKRELADMKRQIRNRARRKSNGGKGG